MTDHDVAQIMRDALPDAEVHSYESETLRSATAQFGGYLLIASLHKRSRETVAGVHLEGQDDPIFMQYHEASPEQHREDIVMCHAAMLKHSEERSRAAGHAGVLR